ncbi:MAG: helix-turn-helix domain-containing protein [Desulfovibrio sp.]|jgi:hypothetical protein|nr:helix-turn-helix domain-containing protein [Desulfovibrio sp.]
MMVGPAYVCFCGSVDDAIRDFFYQFDFSSTMKFFRAAFFGVSGTGNLGKATQQQLADILGFHRTAIVRWVREYRKDGKIMPKVRGHMG